MQLKHLAYLNAAFATIIPVAITFVVDSIAVQTALIVVALNGLTLAFYISKR